MPDNNFIDISLSEVGKKPIRFDNDDNRVVYINISDVGVIGRISDSLPNIENILADVFTVDLTEAETDAEKTANVLSEVFANGDKQIRELIDNIFNAPVSDAACNEGNMLDIFNGSYRFEYILTALMNVYEDNISKEYSTMASKISKHTDKYKQVKQ